MVVIVTVTSIIEAGSHSLTPHDSRESPQRQTINREPSVVGRGVTVQRFSGRLPAPPTLPGRPRGPSRFGRGGELVPGGAAARSSCGGVGGKALLERRGSRGLRLRRLPSSAPSTRSSLKATRFLARGSAASGAPLSASRLSWSAALPPARNAFCRQPKPPNNIHNKLTTHRSQVNTPNPNPDPFI